jgi:acetylornithine deacetylase/succinyl-diaminopimelate desuccinylase-like protein
MSDPITYARENEERFLHELKAFLRIPSVSTQPERDEETAQAAGWLAEAMETAGLENVQVIETARHPLVYADWLNAGPGAPTVLIYGHYDVQPAEPLEEWETPPFEPAVRDGFLYARGGSDNKGQHFAHVKAIEALLQTEGRLPVNVKFIVEGEEESGGASLAAFIPAHKEMLAADVALVSDTSIHSPTQPTIVYGLRGICYVLMDITGPGRDLHSGSFGGGVNNPLNVLGHVIAKLKDEDGRILIPGFYDQVRPLSDEERQLLAKSPLDEEEWLAETGAPEIWGEPEYTLVERLGARPTLDVHGVIGGYTGAGAKTVLPSSVHAKISMRLVPDQDPQRICRLFQEYVRELVPPSVTVSFDPGHGAPASITDYHIPAMQAAQRAYADAFGAEPIMVREGGSIPVVGHFQTQLGLETVLMGFGLPGDRIHAPNERFYLPNFYRGIETGVRFLQEYAALSDG